MDPQGCATSGGMAPGTWTALSGSVSRPRFRVAHSCFGARERSAPSEYRTAIHDKLLQDWNQLPSMYLKNILYPSGGPFHVAYHGEFLAVRFAKRVCKRYRLRTTDVVSAGES